MVKKQSKIDWSEPEYSPSHDFEKIPIVEGILVRKDTLVIKGKEVSLVVLDTEKGEETIWLGAVLKSSLGEVEVGSYVGVKYLGQEKSAEGYTYRNYAVRVIPPEIVE